MKEFTLPERSETEIRLTVGGVTKIFDLFEFEEIYNETLREAKSLGILEDTKAVAQIFIDKFKSISEMELSISAAFDLIAGVLEFREELKKKYPDSPESSDTTELTPSMLSETDTNQNTSSDS